MSAEENLELMQTLDDVWNAQDWDTFEQRHKSDTTVSWPGQPPTHGIKDHRAEGVAMFKTFPDDKVGNRRYKALFASDDWTCSIARFTGTMTGPMVLADGTEIPRRASPSRSTSAPWRAGTTARSSRRTLLRPGREMSQLGLS